MSLTYHSKKLLRRHPLESLLSQFFHFLAQSSLIAKIKFHGRFFATSYDFVAIVMAWGLATFLVLDSGMRSKVAFAGWQHFSITSASMILIQFMLMRYVGLSRGFWRFASIQDLQKIVSSALIGGLIIDCLLSTHIAEIIINTQSGNVITPSHAIALLYTVFLIALLSSARLCVRFAKDFKNRHQDCKRVIVIGAGNAGEGLVRDLLRDNNERYKPIAFVDNDQLKLGREIHGVPVIGTIKALPALVAKYRIDLVLIAIPSASSSSMRTVVDLCEKASVRYYTLPGIKDLTHGRVNIDALRHILLEDLLGRYPVTYQWASIKTYLANKTILITGGGGSIGSEICRQITSLGCNTQLVILDNNEYNLYSIDLELNRKYPNSRFYPALLNITDRIGVQNVFKKYSPDIVFHAAVPYKQYECLDRWFDQTA
jgi:FlaA1/EpsC-like NDP-sugar epimerase